MRRLLITLLILTLASVGCRPDRQQVSKPSATPVSAAQLLAAGFVQVSLPDFSSPVYKRSRASLGDLAALLQFEIGAIRATESASGPRFVHQVPTRTGRCYIEYLSPAGSIHDSKAVVNVILRPYTRD